MTPSTESRAWYLKIGREDVGDCAVLVGDRGRVRLAATLLDDAELVNEDRGLTTATGTYRGTRVTVSAFGMGAPIAAVVLHELAELGVRRVVRLGTAMSIGPTRLGDFVIAEGAIRSEGTSATYLPVEFPSVPDRRLTAALITAGRALKIPVRTGIYATYDGFYTEMFDRGVGAERVSDRYDRLARMGAVAVDMETSAVLVVARALGIAAASCCIASVEGGTNDQLPRDRRLEAESTLLTLGFDALVASAPSEGIA